MNRIFNASFLLVTAVTSGAYAQGWYAEIDLDLNHGLYAYERISNAQVTFSGVTVSGSSPNSNLRLTAMGTGPATGSITVTATGTAWQPYDPGDPYSQSLPTVRFTGTYDTPCETAFFEQPGDLQGEDLYIWVKIYPRLEIADFILHCEQVTLITNTCSDSYRWEVSDSPTGNFKALSGKSTPSISVTRQELIALGFTNPFGRKYFRVTGRQNTTSQLQPVDIFYPGPTASVSVNPPTCHNGQNGSLTVDIQSAYPDVINDYVITLFNSVPPTGQVAQDYINDSARKQFSGLAAGSYWVRIENNTNKDVYGNCWTDYAAGTLINPAPVTVQTSVSSYNGFGVTCTGSQDGIIEVVPSGGSGAYDVFEWSPLVSTTSVARNLTAGSYQVKVTDTKGCSSESVTRIVTAPQPLTVQLYSSGGRNGYDVSCHDHADGKIETSVSGGAPGYSYLWSDNSITPSVADVPAGDYSVSVTDANGCRIAGEISLKAPAPISFTIEEISPVNCPGNATGALEAVSVRNTIGQPYYSWSSGEDDNAIYNKVSGIYTATISDDQGCHATQTHTLAEPLLHTAEILATSDFNGSPIKCNGTATGALQATVRDASGAVVAGQEYTWFRNDVFYETGQNMEALKAVDAATYRVSIRYTEYCTTETTYLLEDPDPVKVDIETISNYNGTAISCHGSADGGIAAAASGGTGELTFLWNTGATTPSLTKLSEGTYSIVVMDANQCSANAQTTLTDPEPVKPDIRVISDFNGAALSCADASDGQLSATVTGGAAPYSFRWDHGAVGAELKNVPAGSYTVTTTDVNGCTGRITSSIVAPPPLLAAIVDSSNYNGYGTTCAGSTDGFLTAAGSGGTGTFRYEWLETKATTNTNSNLRAGTYNVMVMDLNGCNASVRAVILEPDPVIISDVILKNVSCHGGSDGEITLHVIGGTGLYEYSTNAEDWQTDQRLANLESGEYQPRARDNNGCTITTTQTLTAPKQISIAFNHISPALCGEAIGEVSAEVSGGTGAFQFEWFDVNANMVSDNSTASALGAGVYTVVFTDGLGCQATDIAGVSATDGPRPRIAEINPASCSYTSDGSASIEVIEGAGPFSFLWNDGQNSEKAINLHKGNYLVQITDINRCTAVETVIIPGPDSLTIELAEMIEPRCFGDCNGQISASAKGGTGPYTYDWALSSGPVIKEICAGEYVLQVNDQQNCVAQETFNLGQPEPIELYAPLQQAPSCPEHCDGQLELQATGGTGELLFTWSDGRTGPALRDLCAGEYTAIVKDNRECMITASYTLPSPVITPPDLGGSVTLCVGQTHLLDAGPDWNDHTWFSNEGFEGDTRTITITSAGKYWLEAHTAQGCVARDTFLLQTSTDLLQANFLVPSEALAGDTIVIIDISWPAPGDMDWNFPPDMLQLEAPVDLIYGKFQKPGTYEISFSAELGACHDEMTKSITIRQEDNRASEEGRLGANDFVKEFALYPNPNDGMFDVVAHFTGESPIVLSVWNVMTSGKIAQLERSGQSHYEEHIDLRPLSAGSYSLRLDYNQGTRYIRFIVR